VMFRVSRESFRTRETTDDSPRVAAKRAPLVESAALQSVLCLDVPDWLGCADPTLTSLFPAGLVVFRRSRSPSTIKKTGSSSRELCSPSETIRLSPARCARRAPSVGFRTSSRCQQPESTSDGVPRPRLTVPPSAFLTPSTVCSSGCLASLFHPATTSRVIASGVSSHRPVCADSSPSLPTSPLAPESCHLAMAPILRHVDLVVLY
jgi:hypothetical protein